MTKKAETTINKNSPRYVRGSQRVVNGEIHKTFRFHDGSTVEVVTGFRHPRVSKKEQRARILALFPIGNRNLVQN